MIEFTRYLDLKGPLATSSQFLFGPRGTGKSYLIRKNFMQKDSEQALVINLLKNSDFLRLAENPSLLEEMIRESGKKLVIIDEVQKLPPLLDEVHRLIEEQGITFLLTGSSARKLKRGHANLLAGRARILNLYPLIHQEIEHFKLEEHLLWGGMPTVYNLNNENEKMEFLDNYIETYLKEEILSEQLARSLPKFSRFLKIAALSSGQLINFAQMASDAHLPASTVKNYFEVFQDTLVGTLLEPWTESKKRKAILTGKFYIFDTGVKNRLLGINAVNENTEHYGDLFEHFIFSELTAFAHYTRPKIPLYFWRSTSQNEVDFILGDSLAIEVKAKKKVSDREAKGLCALREENKHKHFVLVSRDEISREKDGILYLYWEEFIRRLWKREFI